LQKIHAAALCRSPSKKRRITRCLRGAAFEEQRCDVPFFSHAVLPRSCKKTSSARRTARKQGEGVVGYVEPLSRNNAAMCRFFHTPFFPVLVKKQAAQGVPQESKAKA